MGKDGFRAMIPDPAINPIISARNDEIFGTVNEVTKTYGKHQLVGGLDHFLFFHLLGMSSSQLTNIFQRG